MRIRIIATALAASLLPLGAAAKMEPADIPKEQVRFIKMSVPPYYESSLVREEPPTIRLVHKHRQKLASLARADVASVRDAVAAEPQAATPLLMMILAVRLYDVGLRDDAAFWFYAARDRFDTLAGVMDADGPYFAETSRAVRAIQRLAGPAITGYALCDPARQKRIRKAAFEWVEKNPYPVLFTETIEALPGDRRANLRRVLEGLRAKVKEEEGYFDDPANLAKLAEGRKATYSDQRYCW